MYRRFAATVGCAVALAASTPALAGVFASQPPLGLYEARTILTGTDARSRPTGLATCLEDVLVKVSGDGALRGDPRVAALDPSGLVVGFSYVDRLSGIPHHDDQGSSDRPFYFTARFDPARIDAQLRALGDAPYDGARPTLLPLVFVSAPGASYLLTQDGPHAAGQREAVAEAGDRLGLPVHLPTAPEVVGGTPPGALPLSGTLAWSDAAHGWVGDWSMTYAGAAHSWRSSGGSYDAAFQSAMRGALGVLAGHKP